MTAASSACHEAVQKHQMLFTWNTFMLKQVWHVQMAQAQQVAQPMHTDIIL